MSPIAGFVFNVAKGRIAAYADRVNGNDPANSALIILAFNTAATDATLKDLDTVAAIEADASTAEVTNTGYARKVLTDASGITVTTDDTGDKVVVVIPDQTWTTVAAGSAWTDLCIAYDNDTTGGTDANLIPLVWLDFPITPDGSDVVADFDSVNGFWQAT